MSGHFPLGIVAGGKEMPIQLMQACQAQGRPVFVLGFEGITDMAPFQQLVPHAQLPVGFVGKALQYIHDAGVKELVLAGHFQRPKMSALRFDIQGMALMARMGTKFLTGGDDALLKVVIGFIEEQGFRVIGVHDVLPELLAPEGTLGTIHPDGKDMADIAQGIKAAKALGARDAGQAVIIKNGEVLGEEDGLGTDALITRCARPGGVLVKMEKPGQDSRVDRPSIGPETVEKAHAAGLKGIAVEAKASLIVNKDATIRKADELGLFVVGVRHAG
jgi:UDP-2,3-diacylglucosamine hydrolase